MQMQHLMRQALQIFYNACDFISLLCEVKCISEAIITKITPWPCDCILKCELCTRLLLRTHQIPLYTLLNRAQTFNSFIEGQGKGPSGIIAVLGEVVCKGEVQRRCWILSVVPLCFVVFTIGLQKFKAGEYVLIVHTVCSLALNDAAH